MNVSEMLRSLAKSQTWQILYIQAKEIHIGLFKNRSDYTQLQVVFLALLAFYSSLNDAIGLGETTDRVLENDVYAEAYMYWRQEVKFKKALKQTQVKRDTTQVGRTSQWVFKNPKRGII